MKRTVSWAGALITCALIVLSSTKASGQTLENWKDAARKTGCAGIPYSSLQDSCTNKQGDVIRYCKSSSNLFSCKGFETKGVLEAIEGIKGAIEKLKASKDEQSNIRSNAKTDDERRDAEEKIRDLEDKIYKAQGRLEASKRQVDENKSEAEKRTYNGEKCRDARQDVQGVFTDVISRAKGESDPAIKAIASDKISSEWEPELRAHNEHIKDVVLPAITYCRDCRSGDK